MSRTRSKQAKETKQNTHSDTTFQTNLYLFDNVDDLVLEEMSYRGRLKAQDWARLQNHHNQTGQHLTREERQAPLLSLGLSYREARSIIEANDDLYEAATRVARLDTDRWCKDVPNVSHDKARYLQSRVSRKHLLSVCLGGKGLFRKAQSDVKALELWREKRLFLQMGGEADRKQGNASIRLFYKETSIKGITFEVHLKCFGERNFVPIGEALFKRGGREILAALEARNPVSVQVLRRGGRYKLHVTPRVPSVIPPKSARSNAAGVDFNSKHVEVTVVDWKANIIAQTSFPWDKGDDMPRLSEQVFQYVKQYGVAVVGIENLSGLQANRASKARGHQVAAVRRVVNQLPTKRFELGCVRASRKHNILLSLVSPRDTSKLTCEWSEPRWGLTVHDKASYLIARRTLGYSIKRRTRKGSGVVQRINPPTRIIQPSIPQNKTVGWFPSQYAQKAQYRTNLMVMRETAKRILPGSIHYRTTEPYETKK